MWGKGTASPAGSYIGGKVELGKASLTGSPSLSCQSYGGPDEVSHRESYSLLTAASSRVSLCLENELTATQMKSSGFSV